MYPAIFEGISATQFISLHLALQSQRHSHHVDQVAPGDFFQPFLASLPTSFPTIPLSWKIKSLSTPKLLQEYSIDSSDVSVLEREYMKQRDRWRALLELLPPSVATRTLDVEERFKADWLVTRDIWVIQDDVMLVDEH